MQLKIGYLFQCPPRAAPWVHSQLTMRPERAKALHITWYLKAFALTGRQACIHHYPGRCPGLGASALSGRVEITCKNSDLYKKKKKQREIGD